MNLVRSYVCFVFMLFKKKDEKLEVDIKKDYDRI